MTKNNPNYAVGFGKPPAHTRFKKGRSGNPKGRPKTERGFEAVLRRELASLVPIVENGRRRTASKQEAIMKQLVKNALMGDMRAIKFLLESRFWDQAMAQEDVNPDKIDPEQAAKEVSEFLKHIASQKSQLCSYGRQLDEREKFIVERERALGVESPPSKFNSYGRFDYTSSEEKDSVDTNAGGEPEKSE